MKKKKNSFSWYLFHLGYWRERNGTEVVFWKVNSSPFRIFRNISFWAPDVGPVVSLMPPSGLNLSLSSVVRLQHHRCNITRGDTTCLCTRTVGSLPLQNIRVGMIMSLFWFFTWSWRMSKLHLKRNTNLVVFDDAPLPHSPLIKPVRRYLTLEPTSRVAWMSLFKIILNVLLY